MTLYAQVQAPLYAQDPRKSVIGFHIAPTDQMKSAAAVASQTNSVVVKNVYRKNLCAMETTIVGTGMMRSPVPLIFASVFINSIVILQTNVSPRHSFAMVKMTAEMEWMRLVATNAS